MTKQQIKKELEKSFEEVIEWIQNQEDERFELGPLGKWNSSQQLDHLHKTTKAINKAMKIPKLLLRYKFGKANRPSRSFEELKEKYLTKIKNLPSDFKQPMPPRSYPPDLKKDRIIKYQKEADTMILNSNKWSENNLDKYVLPHPAVGKLTIKEFLMWTVIHNEHHLKILREKY